ncbi:MAG: RNA polymerase sigma factor [Balneolaceae bacterium]|nr:RNA polymerase sigma factor [Balneolaceae bacterium]
MENEEALIARLKQRDRRAFNTLVEREKDRVFNTCLGFLHNREDAEDTAQEVFMELHESIDDFRGDSTLRTWLYRIAVTKSLELIRYRNRKKRWGFFQAMAADDPPDPDETPSDTGFDHPGVELEKKERATLLMHEIARLTEKQRVAITLQKLEGLSYSEIADVMETTVSAVESLVHRATRNLEQQLADYFDKQIE